MKHRFGTAVKFLDPDDIEEKLVKRLGRLHARQRLGIEMDHEAQVFGQGLNFFHIENSALFTHPHQGSPSALGAILAGTEECRQDSVEAKRNCLAPCPKEFRWLPDPLSDLHADMSQPAMARIVDLLPSLEYDLCVLTGDYRGKTFGPFNEFLAGMARLQENLKGSVYGVLGNHDTIRMIPDLEAMGIRMLLNECVVIERDGQRIHLAGVDDAHFFRVDNIEKAADAVPHEEFSILLSHTPEIYRQAAHAGFDLLLSGHTHGGQICLPGGIPITLNSALPRSLGSGAWKYRDMTGYTSVGAGSSVVLVRFNCPPEITLHHLHSIRQSRNSIRPIPDLEPIEHARSAKLTDEEKC